MKWVPLLVMSLFAVTTAAAETGSSAGSPLEGRWSLDISGLPMPPAERPRQVTVAFKPLDSGKWHSHVEITFQDGKVMTADATPPLDGTPSPVTGDYYANETTLRLPAPNTLVMQLVDHGTPTSTRVFTVAGDAATMTETKAFFSKEGRPILQTFSYRRLP